MSQMKDGDPEPPCVHIISDSDDSNPQNNGFPGFPSAQKRLSADGERLRDLSSVRKKLKIDGDRMDTTEEVAIDVDSISTNPRRTRTKVSSDTSSKFPVSSPSDTLPIAGHRKKYVKNTLPAGAFERMLNEVSQNHPSMTYQEKLDKWKCCNDLSDVEDVNNFDDLFQQREQVYRKTISSRRTTGKDTAFPNYNYQHFRTVILESFRGSPISRSPSLEAQRRQHNNGDQPSCSKEPEAGANPINSSILTPRLEPTKVIHYEKILCPSSESSATKASPSIRLHWTDEDSVFRLNRLNPEIDKFSKLIKVRIDYNKQINLKAIRNEIFKTPIVPPKYNCDYESPGLRNSLEDASDEKSIEPSRPVIASKKIPPRTIETRLSSSGRNSDSKNSPEKFPEVESFQQDEFCNYLGLGMNGKVQSPIPTDNKRRSLRVKRQQQLIELEKKNKDKKETSKAENDTTVKKSPDEQTNNESATVEDKEAEVTTTVNEIRNSLSSPLTIKILERTMPEEPKHKPTKPQAPHTPPTEIINKSPEIKILLKLVNSPTSTPTIEHHTPSTITTKANSAVQPPIRRLRHTRATSNGTSTCPRSSQSDESPTKSTPRRRRVNHHPCPTTNNTSDLSESLLSDPHLHDSPPIQNGRASTIPSSDGQKEEITSTPHEIIQPDAEELHKKFQRYLEESRKTKPSIFIVDSLDSSGSKANVSASNNNNTIPNNTLPKKATQIPKKKIVRRKLLKRNGAIGGTLNQKILRNNTVIRPLMIKISKHPLRKKIKAMKKKQAEAEAQALVEKAKNDEVVVTPEEPLPEVPEEKSKEKGIQTESELKPLLEDVQTQTERGQTPLPITFLTPQSSRLPNPLSAENGPVIYAYYEQDILIVVQELTVTFWKTSKLIEVLSKPTCEWIFLGECRRLLHDDEIITPHKNRICVHNSIPVYVEMRSKAVPKIRRDCNLLSIYINVYYYHDEEMLAKAHSIQLDTVASLPQTVVYTTITDSRYFVMCWAQENMLGKPRSGLCKYSLTPQLDTLASIREFKCMRHEIRHLECTTDDNLIGFGDSQVTLWDHRSGDILMNYDLNFNIGSNLGSIYYPSLEVGQDKTVLIVQKTSTQEVSIIAINISHNAPSHRFVCRLGLPAEFQTIQTSMQTDDYVILTNPEHQELWIDCSDPQSVIQIKSAHDRCRFYARCKQNVIEICGDHLALEPISTFVLKMINQQEEDH